MNLKPFQRKALSLLEKPIHLICIAATGSGKSLIFQQKAARPSQKTLLISPLRALIRQQILQLQEKGISIYNAKLPEKEAQAWVMSPEKLFSPRKERTFELLKSWKPNFLVVDECHCLWDWGPHFRPAFQFLPNLVHELKIPTSLWLTATLPLAAQRLLLSHLPQPSMKIGRFEFPEKLFLKITNISLRDRPQALLQRLLFHPIFSKHPGIIFVNTRESTRRLKNLLSQTSKRTVHYHAGMSTEEKENLETQIHQKQVDVIIATSAFGMGMDFRQLRWAILWQAPFSLLGLTQAIGRVGRSKKPGLAEVLWHPDDFRLSEWVIRDSPERRKNLSDLFQFLNTSGCRLKNLSPYFEESDSIPCGRCDYCGGSSGTLNKVMIL